MRLRQVELGSGERAKLSRLLAIDAFLEPEYLRSVVAGIFRR